MFKKLDEIASRRKAIEEQLKILSGTKPPDSRLLKEYAQLSKITCLYEDYKTLLQNISNCQKIINNPQEDLDLITLAQEEIQQLKRKEESLLKELQTHSCPADKMDHKDAVMEFRQGAGGNEAALFCEELFSLYSHYADKQKWRMEILSSSGGNSGGFRELVCSVSGPGAYAHLKYESGVHRVQRVPRTESQGRVHTSTVTLAVLPQAGEQDVRIRTADIRVDTFRSSGAGGQHVNTTDSAVRVVHAPTQITVQCQDEKSQHANKEKAMKVLYARLYDRQMQEQKVKESKARTAQIGTGSRSEKVRTYNFPQTRVTDHRTGLTVHNLDEVMKGNIQPFIEALKKQFMETAV